MTDFYKYRLRSGKKILGYANETAGGLRFHPIHSTFQSSSLPSNYNHSDISSGIKDKFSREVFVQDIVRYKLNTKELFSEGVVFQTSGGTFKILDLKHKTELPVLIENINLFSCEPLEVISHLFNHPELSEKVVDYLLNH